MSENSHTGTGSAPVEHVLSTGEKAQRINNNPAFYGVFSEIGAGQEVARSFFRAGRASATIAKTMSAYDKEVSDSIYGVEESKRYVCESRLRKMLDREFTLVRERLTKVRDSKTQFFAFADTVTCSRRVHQDTDAGHGWLGVQFQDYPGDEPSELVMHVRLLDMHSLEQQEAVGVLGVNLLYGCFHHSNDPGKILKSMSDGLRSDRFEIDMVRFSGPAFKKVDNRLMSLYLVEFGLTNAVLFSPQGEALQPSDVLYGKNLLVQRGRFRPVTLVHLDMLEAAKKQFLQEPGVNQDNLLVFMEVTMNNFMKEGRVDAVDFLSRIDLLSLMGHHVLISNYLEYHRLSEFFGKYTKGKVGVVMGVGHLPKIFDQKFYENVSGGMLEALGKLFRKNVTALIYPAFTLEGCEPQDATKKGAKLYQAKDFKPAENLHHLFLHLMANHCIADLKGADERLLVLNSDKVLELLQSGIPGWESHVPTQVAELIAKRGLFGYRTPYQKVG